VSANEREWVKSNDVSAAEVHAYEVSLAKSVLCTVPVEGVIVHVHEQFMQLSLLVNNETLQHVR
jgi:hypothetical protein